MPSPEHLNQHADDGPPCARPSRIASFQNPKTALYKALHPFQTRMRIMVTGTPIQNDLDEFYALMNFAIPGCLGDPKAFDKEIGRPIIRSRDLEATDAELLAGRRASAALTRKLDLMMLRRTNEVMATPSVPTILP